MFEENLVCGVPLREKKDFSEEEQIKSTPYNIWVTPEAPVKDREGMTYLGWYRITGYDTCIACCGKTDGITASGTNASVGRTCAAARNLPFGTVIYIEGIGYRTVEDRGGGVNGNHIDVLCANHDDCYAITGYANVWIVEE